MGLQFTKQDDEEKIVKNQAGSDDAEDPGHHDDPEHHEHGPLTCRQKLKEFLHTQMFQVAIICLVVLDCIFVIGELILDYEKLSTNTCEKPAPSTEPQEGNNSDHGTGEPEQEVETESAVTKAAEALHILSLIILSIFMVELILKFYALGTEFCHSKLEVFDAVVIIVSFILDILTLIFPDDFAVLDLIVVLRLWRIIRVVNGVILSVEQRAEKKINHFKRIKDRAIHAVMKFEQYSSALEEEIHVLRELVERSGVKLDEEMFKNKPEKPHYDKKYHTVAEDGVSHHHHHFNPFHRHHRDKSVSNKVDESPSEPTDTNQLPDYHTIQHGNEADC